VALFIKSEWLYPIAEARSTPLISSYSLKAGSNIYHVSSISGRHLIPETLSSYPTNLPCTWHIWEEEKETWDHIPDTNNLSVTIRHHGIDQTFKGYEIADKRLSIFYNAADSYKPRLYLNGNIVATGNATTLSNHYDLIVLIDHAYQAYQNPTYGDSSNTISLASGSGYVIVHDFGSISSKVITRENQQLSGSLTAGLPDDSEAVLGGGLQVTALTGLQEWYLSRKLFARLSDTIGYAHHFIGITGQEQGYYVDLPDIAVSMNSRTNSTSDEESWFKASSFFSSALEHGVLEQSQGIEKKCVSTIKLLQISNSTSNKTYIADSNNWDTVQNNLTNYSPFVINQITAYINAGCLFILPEDAEITLLDWTGMGYVHYFSDRSGYEMGMIISGGYKGGYSGREDDFDSGSINNLVETAYEPLQDANTPVTTSREPVDLHTGDYTFNHTDLALSGIKPHGLRLSRSYNSGRRTIRHFQGCGWTHNYNIKACKTSHGSLGLGARLPADAAPLIVQSFVTLDLIKNDPDIEEWVSAVLATKWGMDQLIDNAVVIQLGNKSLEYTKMPDSSYNPPPGETSSLQKQNNCFALKKRFGTIFTFNTNGTISSWQDADSNTLSFAYNAQTNLQTVTDCHNRALTFSYTSGKLTQVSDGTGRTVSFGYTNDDLTGFTDPDGGVWEYQYDTNHQMTALIDPLDQMTASNIYNDVGQVITQYNGFGKAWSFYISGYQGIEQDPEGSSITHYFDKHGRNLGAKDALGSRTYKYYDTQGQLLTNIDANANVTVFYYDNSNNMTSRVDALTNTTVFGYDSDYHLISATDPLGHTTLYGYDSEHHLTNIVDALSNNTAMTYFPNGLLQQITTDNEQRTTDYTYDNYGNPHTITRTDGGTITNTYNARGDLLTARDANGNLTTMTYNKRRLITSAADALGNIVSNVYNSAGLKTYIIDQLGRETVFTWTPTYNMASVTYPNAGIVSNSYDSCDRLLAIKDAKGNITSNVYDKAGRKIAVIDALGSRTGFVLDANGNLIAQTNALGKVTTFVYDKLNRLVMTTDPLNHSVSNTFDAAGRLIAVTDADGCQTKYEYDALGRRTMVTKADGTRERFEYDANGNLVTFYNGLSKARTFAYDGMNRVTNEVDAVGNSRSFVFDPVGNLLERHAAASAITEYEYDELNHLVQIVYPDTTTVVYAYNAVGLRTLVSNAVADVHYAYNSMNRLSSVTQSVQSVSSVVNYSYDLTGNRTNVVYPDGKTVGYAFNAANRLTEVSPSGFSLQALAFSYDGIGDRTVRVEGGITNYHVLNRASALHNVLMEADSSGTPVRFYVWGPNGLLAQVESDGTTHYFHADEQGSTLALTDGDGNVTDQFGYTPYGEICNRTGTTHTPYLYIEGVRKGSGLTVMLANNIWSGEPVASREQKPSME